MVHYVKIQKSVKWRCILYFCGDNLGANRANPKKGAPQTRTTYTLSWTIYNTLAGLLQPSIRHICILSSIIPTIFNYQTISSESLMFFSWNKPFFSKKISQAAAIMAMAWGRSSGGYISPTIAKLAGNKPPSAAPTAPRQNSKEPQCLMSNQREEISWIYP